MSQSSKAPPSGISGTPCEDGFAPASLDPGAADACCARVKRGRPSVAEAEQLSGKILDASWEVLLAEGFESFTFDRIARHARIGKATIYSRFASKYDLLHALLFHRTTMRRDFIMAQGAGRSVIEAFCLRAAEMLTLLSSPDGKLLERLIDWLDEEKMAAGQPRVREMAYREAIENIAQSFAESNAAGETHIADVTLAAEFWLEGLLGHARRRDSLGRASREENESWARIFADYFFAGITAVSAASESA